MSQEKLGLHDGHTAKANTYSTLMTCLLVLIKSVMRLLYMLTLAVWASCSSSFLCSMDSASTLTVHQMTFVTLQEQDECMFQQQYT